MHMARMSGGNYLLVINQEEFDILYTLTNESQKIFGTHPAVSTGIWAHFDRISTSPVKYSRDYAEYKNKEGKSV